MIRLFENAKHAEAYAKFRPKTPQSVVDIMMSYMKSRSSTGQSGLYSKMIDVGCGSGQSTEIFSSHFEHIIGIDLSAEQIEIAKKNNKVSNISYNVGPAEDIKQLNESVDLVTCGQAIHWLDFNKFFIECHRILKPGGCLLVHGYDRPRIFPTLNNQTALSRKEAGDCAENLFSQFYKKCKFHPRRTHIDDHYSRVFAILKSDKKEINESVTIQSTCKLKEFVSYINTWSGYRAYIQESQHGRSEDKAKKIQPDILSQFIENLKEEWHLAEKNFMESEIEIVWNVFMIMSERPHHRST